MFVGDKMKKTMENEIDKRYSEILRNLYVNWMLGLKNKNEELKSKGLDTSGVGIEIIYNLIEKLAFNTCENLDNMFEDIKKEFNTKIPLKVLKKYIDKSINSIFGHLNNMQEDIANKFGNDILVQSNESSINNIKGNVKAKLERIYDKNKNLQKFKKIEWLVIINTIATIGGFIISIIGLIKSYK